MAKDNRDRAYQVSEDSPKSAKLSGRGTERGRESAESGEAVQTG